MTKEDIVYQYVMDECVWGQNRSGKWVASIGLIDEEYSSEAITEEMAKHALAYKASQSSEMKEKVLELLKNKNVHRSKRNKKS